MESPEIHPPKIDERVLGIIVVFDEYRSSAAISSFKKFLDSNYSNSKIRIISNNDNISAEIKGSNVCGEFSGWAEALEPEEINHFDFFIFANDTFTSHGRFDPISEKNFVEMIAQSQKDSNKFLVGEVGWHIDYQLARQRKYFLINWVRTSIFAISSTALRDIQGVSLTETEIEHFIKENQDGSFYLCSCLPQIVRKRIETWLRPSNVANGWHGVETATKELLSLKAKCVLQEILLTRRCLDRNVALYDHRKINSRRQFSLRSAFYVQNKIFNFGYNDVQCELKIDRPVDFKYPKLNAAGDIGHGNEPIDIPHPKLENDMIEEQKNSTYWNNFYMENSKQKELLLPSQFAAFVLGESHDNEVVIEFGCGNGRDAAFFARHGKNVAAYDLSSSGITINRETYSGLRNLTFDICDAVKTVPEIRFNSDISKSIYARFFIHALNTEEIQKFFKNCRKMMSENDSLFIEYRTKEDAKRKKSTADHYRNFLDPALIDKMLSDVGLSTSYFVQGIGFAKWKEDDAAVARHTIRIKRS